MICGGIVLTMSVLQCANSAVNVAQLYGPTSAENYLSGKFDPLRHPLFVRLSDLGIPCDRPHYLRRDTAEALKKMYTALKKDLPGVKFWVQSSTRNWFSQKSIWERKWKFYKKQNPALPDREIALLILRYSSMPGTSRHHWGTDFDINILRNDYYGSGEGKKLYTWLRANAGRFGFCQPYTAGRTSGYAEERWHWSYVPVASELQRQWNSYFREDPSHMAGRHSFLGFKSAAGFSPVYVNSIGGGCTGE
ncbi:MAG TPA: M15 family metallopeptidase [Spirochaetota bacterium]|nr:M15 family metallopeptidase [Spirochaetota bacterium]